MLFVTVALTIYAASTGGADAAIGLNIMWAYALIAAAVASAIFCAVIGMVQSPAGLKSTVISIVLVAAVIGISYLVASGHTIQVPNIETGGFFESEETVITETSVMVTYITFGAAIIMAIVSEIWGAFK